MNRIERLEELAEIKRLKAENEALRKPKWIRCSEAMPEINEEVLAIDEYGQMDFGSYFIGYRDKLCFSSNAEISLPTHWMRCPAPPAKEQP